MWAFIKAVFAAPVLGALSFVLALPYLALAVAGYVAPPWFTLPTDWTAAISGMVTNLPIGAEIMQDVDPARAFEALVIGYLLLLFLYRIQSGALRLVGVAPAHPVRALFLPAWRWWIMPGFVLIAFLVEAYLAAETSPGITAVFGGLQTPMQAASLPAYYAEYAGPLRAIFIGLMALFVLFGLTSLQNTTGVRSPERMALQYIPKVVVLGVIHGVLSAFATVVLFQFAPDFLPAGIVDTFGTAYFAMLINAGLFFVLMSTAAAILLRARLEDMVAVSSY